MLPGMRSLAAALQLEIYWVYTLHLSSCCFVGCVHLPQSHRYLYPSSFKLLLCWLRSLTPVT
ncbi:hypothetical protein [Photorhabdus australis]|uniref:hypothetical protein n=1 Tax=Photorhabdus australis TaxID=286156 RepID=UPI0030DD0211